MEGSSDGSRRHGSGGSEPTPVGGVGGASNGGSPPGGASFGGSSAGTFFGGTGNVPTGGVSGGGSPTGGAGTAGLAGLAGLAGFAGFSGSGMAGQAGSGGSSMLGDPCTINGSLGCHGAAQKLTLRCDGGFWRANGTCDLNTNCDQRNGLCTPIPPECRMRAPGQRFCRMDVLVACGVDNVTIDDVEDCPGRCAESGNTAMCVPPNCGDGRVQSPEQCDDANLSNTDDCTNACASAACGDGFIWVGHETCDDRNQTGGDRCSPTCLWEAGAVAASNTGTCAIGANLALQCWGYNVYGQSGLGDTQNRGDSTGEVGPSLPVVNLGSGRTARVVATRVLTSCAVLDNDTLKCWGYNGYGQLGLGDSTNRGSSMGQMGDALFAVDLGSGRRVKAVTVGGYHVCAILDDDSLKCWGYNVYGGLGLGDTGSRGSSSGHMGDLLPRVNLGTGRSARAVASGLYATCAILDDGRVKCWGYNAFGQLGLGDTANRGDAAGEMGDALPTVNLGTGRSARAVASGDGFTCALLDNGQVKCWGANTYGRLGLGDAAQRGDGPGEMGDALPALSFGTGRRVLSFDLGATHGCAVLDNLTIKCWGQNAQGSLGLGDSNNRGDATNEMGDFLPAVPNGF